MGYNDTNTTPYSTSLEWKFLTSINRMQPRQIDKGIFIFLFLSLSMLD